MGRGTASQRADLPIVESSPFHSVTGPVLRYPSFLYCPKSSVAVPVCFRAVSRLEWSWDCIIKLETGPNTDVAGEAWDILAGKWRHGKTQSNTEPPDRRGQTYLHIAINVVLEWQLAKVHQHMIAQLFEPHDGIKLCLYVLETLVPKRNPCGLSIQKPPFQSPP